MIAIKKVKGDTTHGMKNPIFEIVSFPSLISTGERILGFANARKRADELSAKIGNKNWIHARIGSDKMYKTKEV